MAFALEVDAQISSYAINCTKEEKVKILGLSQELPGSGSPLSQRFLSAISL